MQEFQRFVIIAFTEMQVRNVVSDLSCLQFHASVLKEAAGFFVKGERDIKIVQIREDVGPVALHHGNR